MEDRFRFRVWNNDLKKYEYDIQKGCSFSTYLNKHIVEQCTGLKDKNGKLIYEGDIVKAPHSYKYEVKWGDGNWGLFFGNGQYDICLCEKASKEVEIIGNIHENPDLLGEE